MKAANDNRSKWEEFHKSNPEVYTLIKHFTFKAINAGRKHYGIQTILELVRWHTGVETKGDALKINNNHGAFYARLFMQDYPEYDGFFRTRFHKRGEAA